jgi:hypothetical protein
MEVLVVVKEFTLNRCPLLWSNTRVNVPLMRASKVAFS